MPRVPRRNPNPLNTAPLPAQRTPISGPRRVVETPDIGPLDRSVNRFIEQERERADRVILLEADNKMATLDTDLRTKAGQRRGKNALNVTAEIKADWQKGVGDIEGGLTNDRQLEMFRNRAAVRFQSLYDASERHASSELTRFENEQSEAALANRFNSALENFGDVEEVSRAAVESLAILNDQARANGWSPEVLQERKANALSRIHTGVVARFLMADRDEDARAYLDRAKGQISGEHLARVEEAVQESSFRGLSQRKADEIVDAAASWTEAQALVRAIEDPKLRDHVQDRVNAALNQRKEVEREKQESGYLRATNLVDENPGKPVRAAVPSLIWTTLSLEQRRALENRARSVTHDDRAWLSFLELSPQETGKLTRAQFETRYWSKFDPDHRDRAAQYWAEAVDGVRSGKFDPKFTATLTFKQRLDNAVRGGAYPLIPPRVSAAKMTESQAKTYNALENAAAGQLNELEIRTGRPATPKEVQQIIDSVVMDWVFVRRDRGYALQRALTTSNPAESFRAFQEVTDVSRGEIVNRILGKKVPDRRKLAAELTDDERKAAYVPFFQIPREERAAIIRHATAQGRQWTEEMVEDVYGAVRLGDRARVDAILLSAPQKGRKAP